MKSNSLLLILLLLSCQIGFAQRPVKQSDHIYGGNGSDELRVILQATDGNFIYAGRTTSHASGNKTSDTHGQDPYPNPDYWLIKEDANGNKLWDYSYGSGNDDNFTCIQQTSDAGYIIGGYGECKIGGDHSQDGWSNKTDYWVIKVDANGTKQWDKRFGGDKDDVMTCLQQTTDGGYILGGYSDSKLSDDHSAKGSGGLDYWIVKTDANGTKQWDSIYGGTSDDYLATVIQTADGGYFLAGYSSSGISGDKSQANVGVADYWILKVNTSGVKQWDATFGGSSGDTLAKAIQTSDGGYMLAGYSASGIGGDKSQNSQGGSDYWVLKTDANGVKQFDARFGGSGNDRLTDVKQLSDGNFLLGGYTNSGISGGKTQDSRGGIDYWILKMSGTGAKIFDERFGGNYDDKLFSVLELSDGGFLLGGGSVSTVSGDRTFPSWDYDDFWIVKTSAAGVSNSITTGAISSAPFLQGNTINVPFTVASSFNPGNIFTAQLSDANGDFSSPVTLGTLSSTASGTITGTIPTSVPLGYHYLVRVVGSNPAVIGYDNNLNFMIGFSPRPTKQWDVDFGGSAEDILFDMQNTSDGGYIFGGYSSSGISGDRTQASKGGKDFWVVKTDSVGVKQWDMSYGTFNDDFFSAMQQTSDGGYIFGGTSTPAQSYGGQDYWIVKTDSNGVKEWSKNYGGSAADFLTSLQQTADGGYILGGYSLSGISGNKSKPNWGDEDYWIVKIDANGTKQWDSDFGTIANPYGADLLRVVRQTSDGGYILVGNTEGSATGNMSGTNFGGGGYNNCDFWVVKTDAHGVLQWEHNYGTANNDGFSIYSQNYIRQTPDHGYILAGQSIPDTTLAGDLDLQTRGDWDYVLIKLDSVGGIQWTQRYGTENIDYLQWLELDNDGGYLLGGISFCLPISWDKTQTGTVEYYRDVWVIKTDQVGNELWDWTLNTVASEDYWTHVMPASNGGYVIGTSTTGGIDLDKTSTNKGSWDYWIIKGSNSAAASAIYTSALSQLNYTPGDHLNISFTVNGIFYSGNIFTAQLSDASGSFASPTIIGTLASSTGGTISATIPITTLAGTQYRIRVVSSNPSVIGSDNGQDITIGQLTCDIPSGEYANSIQSTSAKVNWNIVSNAQSYSVRYRKTGTVTWTKVTTFTTTKKLKGLSPNTEYDWTVKSVCDPVNNISSNWSTTQNFTTLPARMGDEETVSSFQVYPNPFSSSTTISFSLEENSHTTIDLFDLAGRKIKTLLDENLEAGDHYVQLDRERLGAGIYLLQVRMNDQTSVLKIIIQ